MGVDLLDLTYRIERELGFKLDLQQIWNEFANRRDPPDVAVGDLYEVIQRQAAAAQLSLPSDSWTRLQDIVADCLGVEVSEVTADARLIHDLDAT